ncbi:MAG: class I SAM-dependent methyltransferase [Planctomycetota bacterium]|jgi:SAM-dependent methyltransferase
MAGEGVNPAPRDDRDSAWAADQVARGNPWYVGSQFEWANNRSIRPIYARRYRFIRDCIERARARLGERLRLLDAGCGDGYWLARLEEIPGLALCGVDYNELRLSRARQVAPEADLRHGDLKAFGADEPFDVVLLSQVVEHVEDDVELLRAVYHMVVPEGVVILGTPNEGSGLQQRWLRRKNRLAQTDHVHFYTEDEIRGKIHEAGFVIDSVMREVFFIGSYPLYYWLTARRWGFRLLEALARLWPSQCSDYYFECRRPP